jgi:DNA repair exonuclease SbcCD ATPase subunit
VLEYASSVAPGLLPDATAMLREAFTPVAEFWGQDFDACASALQMSLPEAARAVRGRELPPSSEIMATLNAQKERSSKLSTEVGVAEAEAAQLAEAVADLVARVAHAESGAERVSECKRRVEALTAMEACLEEIAGASVAGAKFKFEQEKARLQERLEELRRRARSRATVATHDAETERDRLKGVLESLDLIALSKRVGIAEARNAWRDDVPVVAEYRRRLGHVLQALSLLKDIKDNVYSEYVLPELCRRVNATIASVDGNVAVQAVMDPGGIIKWYSVDAGSRVRIKRASGFQQFIVAMGIRVELGTMIRPCRTALIDEGFTACDAQHIQRIPDFLQSLITSGRFDTVLIVTHIEALQNGVSNTLSMRRGERMCA